MAGVTVDREAFDDSADAALRFGDEILKPADLTSADLLGASPALLQGKVLRGGMGTGMPYWGPIFTDRQTWALVDYLWTFQFLYKWRWQNE
jgi:mono/diheme cytochrome c family protein